MAMQNAGTMLGFLASGVTPAFIQILIFLAALGLFPYRSRPSAQDDHPGLRNPRPPACCHPHHECDRKCGGILFLDREPDLSVLGDNHRG